MSPIGIACIGAALAIAGALALVVVPVVVLPRLDRLAMWYLKRRRRDSVAIGVGVPIETGSGRLMTLRELDDAAADPPVKDPRQATTRRTSRSVL